MPLLSSKRKKKKKTCRIFIDVKRSQRLCPVTSARLNWMFFLLLLFFLRVCNDDLNLKKAHAVLEFCACISLLNKRKSRLTHLTPLYLTNVMKLRKCFLPILFFRKSRQQKQTIFKSYNFTSNLNLPL